MIQDKLNTSYSGKFITKKGNYKLVKIPGGEFTRGSPDTEKFHLPCEEPLHTVKVDDFFMGKFPVTNEQYNLFLKENSDLLSPPAYWGDRFFALPKQPVVGISWNEAVKFAQWIGLRLPTDAEWEYSCRAGTNSVYYSGDSEKDLDKVGWYKNNSNGVLQNVGGKEPNKFGLYDMHGNIREWVQDWYDEKYYTNSPKDNPLGPQKGVARTVRGGGWYSVAQLNRAAYRSCRKPDFRCLDFLGFRLCGGMSITG